MHLPAQHRDFTAAPDSPSFHRVSSSYCMQQLHVTVALEASPFADMGRLCLACLSMQQRHDTAARDAPSSASKERLLPADVPLPLCAAAQDRWNSESSIVAKQ